MSQPYDDKPEPPRNFLRVDERRIPRRGEAR